MPPLTSFSSWPQFDKVTVNDHLPPSLSSATPELISPLATSQQDQAANEAQASASVTLDTSQPVTNIQIRLADGGRLVQRFNHTHRWLISSFGMYCMYVGYAAALVFVQVCGSVLLACLRQQTYIYLHWKLGLMCVSQFLNPGGALSLVKAQVKWQMISLIKNADKELN